MKKKIAIMLTLILATEIFKACTAEEKVNNSSLSPTVSTSVGVFVSGKISATAGTAPKQWHYSKRLIIQCNCRKQQNICSLLLSRQLSKALTSLWVLIFLKGLILMKINQITLTDLRRMNGKEGLILQGCGGEIKEWVDGINKMLTDKGILLDDTKFENVSVFKSDGVTCILYPFEDVHLDIGKLAMWRLQSYTAFAGMWLSDYVDNRLGGFEPEQNKAEKVKPDCALIGQDGNIFNLMGIASRTLKQNGMAPFIPHFYVLILDDSNKEERNLGMLAGLSMLWVCDAVWVFGDEITEGMKTEIRFAEKLNIEVRYISENALRKSEIKNDKIKKN